MYAVIMNQSFCIAFWLWPARSLWNMKYSSGKGVIIATFALFSLLYHRNLHEILNRIEQFLSIEQFLLNKYLAIENRTFMNLEVFRRKVVLKWQFSLIFHSSVKHRLFIRQRGIRIQLTWRFSSTWCITQ